MPGSLNQCCLGYESNEFAPHHLNTSRGCADSDCFKCHMEWCDGVIGEIHGNLNHPSTGQLNTDRLEMGQPSVRLANVFRDRSG